MKRQENKHNDFKMSTFHYTCISNPNSVDFFILKISADI